jgi:HK97 family phage major capsid protein
MKPFFTPKEKSEFSVARLLVQASEGGLHGSLEAEMVQEASQRAGKTFSPVQCFIPFELLQRDMTAAGVSGSNYIVGTEKPFALDVLRPYSATLRAGAQMFEFTGNASVPKVTAPSTFTWLPDEFSQIAESQATIGEINITPKNAGGITEISAQLSRQTNIDAFMRRELLRTAGSTLDQAVFAGTGVDGQPQGLHHTAGVNSVTVDATDTFDDVLEMQRLIAEADAGEEITWFGSPSVRKMLAGRSALGGGIGVWNGRTIAGYPAIASRVAPADTLTVGAFAELAIGLWGDGIEIMVNPYSDFSRGKISYRAWLSADVAVTTPAAFAVASVA